MKRALTFDVFDFRAGKQLLDDLNDMIGNLEKIEAEVPQKLCEKGAEVAQTTYDFATYAGANGEVTVTVDKSGNEASVIATGEKVAFIEFGTGIQMGIGWPSPANVDLPWPDGVAKPGEYGVGFGAHPPWGYYGELGVRPPNGTWVAGERNNRAPGGYNPGTAKTRNGKPLIITHGNRPAAAMAKADAEIRVNYMSVVKEVIGK